MYLFISSYLFDCKQLCSRSQLNPVYISAFFALESFKRRYLTLLHSRGIKTLCVKYRIISQIPNYVTLYIKLLQNFNSPIADTYCYFLVYSFLTAYFSSGKLFLYFCLLSSLFCSTLFIFNETVLIKYFTCDRES